MIKYFINAISKGLAFSKNEARGTFALAILVIFVLIFSSYATSKIKAKDHEPYDSAQLIAWVAEVESSYSSKRVAPTKPAYTSTYDHTKPKKEEIIATTAKPQPSKTEEVVLLDLNGSSAEELQKVKGIGKVYSERIVKYREMLGGFSSVDQLVEVYGINQEVVKNLSSQLFIRVPNDVFPINSDSVKTLMKHPYISYDLAWVIINYRRQNGDIKGFEDLKKIKAIDDSLLNKLRPYVE